MSIDILLNEMYDYVVNRNYDIYFCDMVPSIAAKLLQISISIVEKCNGNNPHTEEPRKPVDDARAKKLWLKTQQTSWWYRTHTDLQHSVRQAGFIMGQDDNAYRMSRTTAFCYDL